MAVKDWFSPFALSRPLRPLSSQPQAQNHDDDDDEEMVSIRHRHWLYVWIPLVTAFMWSGTLLAMLITWLATGRPRYSTFSLLTR